MDYKAIRKAAGLTQVEVGQALGLSDSRICDFERGRIAIIAPATRLKIYEYYTKLRSDHTSGELIQQALEIKATTTMGQLQESIIKLSDLLDVTLDSCKEIASRIAQNEAQAALVRADVRNAEFHLRVLSVAVGVLLLVTIVLGCVIWRLV
jgi:transcriptional regulator with XRE-family HTH domain